MSGVIQAKDLLDAYVAGMSPDIRSMVRTAPLDSLDAGDVVSVLKASPVHITIVVDEYAHFEGVVTSADILELLSASF